MEEVAQEQPVQSEAPQLIHPSQYNPEAKVETPKETPTEPVEKAKPATEAPTEVKEETKETVAEKPAAEVKDTPSSPKWEEEKVKLEKRIMDNANWTNRVNQENSQLKQMMAQQQRVIEKISKQMDGSWTDQDEARFNAPPQIDPNALVQEASFKGRLDASMLAADEKYGAEFMDTVVRAQDGPFVEFINNPMVRQAIQADPSPVIKAVEMFKWVQMQSKYGNTPEDFVAGVRKEIEPEVRAKIEKEIKASLKQKGE